MICYVALAGAAPSVVSNVTAVAAGAILAMLVDPMIPKATEHMHEFFGLIAVAGLLIAFTLSELVGWRTGYAASNAALVSAIQPPPSTRPPA